MWVDIYNNKKISRPIKSIFDRFDRLDLDLNSWLTNTGSILSDYDNSLDGVSISQEDSRLICTFEIPGVRKEDISVQYNKSNNQLSVTGKVSNPHTKVKDSSNPKEYKYIVRMDPRYIAEKPSLNSLENGILYLGFDKKEPEKPKDDTIKIEIN